MVKSLFHHLRLTPASRFPDLMSLRPGNVAMILDPRDTWERLQVKNPHFILQVIKGFSIFTLRTWGYTHHLADMIFEMVQSDCIHNEHRTPATRIGPFGGFWSKPCRIDFHDIQKSLKKICGKSWIWRRLNINDETTMQWWGVLKKFRKLSSMWATHLSCHFTWWGSGLDSMCNSKNLHYMVW